MIYLIWMLSFDFCGGTNAHFCRVAVVAMSLKRKKQLIMTTDQIL